MYHSSGNHFECQNLSINPSWNYQEDSNNYQSLIGYINRLFDKRSRLLVIRIDLSFSIGAAGQYDAEHARECFSKFMNNRRCNGIFRNEIGYAWALEWAQDRGFHYHFLFFFDGHESQQDITIGHRIGQYWRDVITQGTGYYHCSNDDKENLERMGYPVGIGMIHRNDHGLRENLLRMATYMLKEEAEGMPQLRSVLPESLRRFRTFGHGGR